MSLILGGLLALLAAAAVITVVVEYLNKSNIRQETQRALQSYKSRLGNRVTAKIKSKEYNTIHLDITGQNNQVETLKFTANELGSDLKVGEKITITL